MEIILVSAFINTLIYTPLLLNSKAISTNAKYFQPYPVLYASTMNLHKFKNLTEERNTNYAENTVLKSSLDQATKVWCRVVFDGMALTPLLGLRTPLARKLCPFGELGQTKAMNEELHSSIERQQCAIVL